MTASGFTGAQIVVAPDIGRGLTAQQQRLRCVDQRPVIGFAVDQV